MDKKQLVTIVITAAVTTTITLTITAFFSVAKRTATSNTTRQNVKKLFSKDNLRLARNIVGLAIFVFLFEREIFKRSPLTRIDVMNIVTYMFLCCVCLSAVIWNISSRSVRRDFLKQIAEMNTTSDNPLPPTP